MLASSAPQSQKATEQLIEGCLQGNQHAWDLIVTRYRRNVFNVASHFVGQHDLAEDLTQEIFLKIFKALGSFDRRANFQTWLISVSRNLCINHYRSVRRERQIVDRSVDAADLSPVSSEPDALVTLERDDRRATCCIARSRGCPDALRAAVLPRDIQELSYQEIAEQLAFPDSCARYRQRGQLDVALRNLRAMTDEKRRAGRDLPFINWRYILFTWNDSTEEMDHARALAEQVGVDRLT